MSKPTNRVTANAMILTPGRLATNIDLDSLSGVTLVDANRDALLGGPLVVHKEIASMDEVGDQVTIVTKPCHLQVQNITVTAKIVVSKAGARGSFGFDIFDSSGKNLKSFPLTACNWDHSVVAF